MCKATTHLRRPRPLRVIASANSPRSVTTTLHNLPLTPGNGLYVCEIGIVVHNIYISNFKRISHISIQVI